MKSNDITTASPPSFEPWIGTADASKYMGVSVTTFRRWLKDGKVKSKRTPTGELRFRRSELDQLIS